MRPTLTNKDKRLPSFKGWRILSVWVVIAVLSVLGFSQERPEISGQPCAEDYSLAAVKSALSLPPGASFSFTDKQIHRLGDRASIAVLKLLNEAELADPAKVRRVLAVVASAFSHPDLISVAGDRNPKVTRFLLSYLERETSAPDLRAEIRSVTESITRRAEKSTRK